MTNTTKNLSPKMIAALGSLTPSEFIKLHGGMSSTILHFAGLTMNEVSAIIVSALINV